MARSWIDMILQLLKISLAACLIAFASWLAGKAPKLAGFIIALPLTSMLALMAAHWEHQNAQLSQEFAVSIFKAVPLSLLFFVPFLFAEKIALPFWGLFLLGIALLAGGYGIHLALSKT
jgi:hypothetical protein